MRKYGRRDASHAARKADFEALGCSVHDTADVGDGFPDLVVGVSGRNVLVEVKEDDGTLTPDQVAFHRDWRGAPPVVVRSQDDVIALVNRVRLGK